MKYFFIFFYIISFFIIFPSCKKENPSPIIDQRTTWFKVTLMNLLEYDADTSKIIVDTLEYNSRKITQIDSYDINNNRVVVSFEGRDTGTYILGATNKFNFVRYANPSEAVWTSFTNSGSLHITKYDTVNKLISGTFNGGIKKISFPFDTIYFNNGTIMEINFTAFK